MTEKIIVGLIVLAAVVFAVRALWKIWSGKGDCSCGASCKACRDSLCRNLKK